MANGHTANGHTATEHTATEHTANGVALRTTASRVVRWILLGAAAGAWAGFFVGGVTGRLAMLILRLTSDDRLRGLETDDGFRIGEFGVGTIFLMVFCAFFGALTGVVYVAARWVLPARFRVPVAAVLGALVGGAMILHGDGIDFRVLEPRTLAIAMFIVVPGVTTAAIASLVERWDGWWFTSRTRTALMSAPLLVPLFLIGVAIAAVAAVPVVVVGSHNDRVRSVIQRHGPPLGRAALLIVASFGGWALLNDVDAIL